MSRWVAINGSGRRIGQEHPNARYTDTEVEYVLTLRESGLTISQIARKLEMPRSTVDSYVKGSRRGQYAERWVRSFDDGDKEKGW